MKRKMILGAIIVCFLVVISTFLYPIGKLALTDTKIVKVPILEMYLADIEADEYDFDVFIEYKENNGWLYDESKRLGGLHVFEKNGELKKVLNTQVKTVLINGKLNY